MALQFHGGQVPLFSPPTSSLIDHRPALPYNPTSTAPSALEEQLSTTSSSDPDHTLNVAGPDISADHPEAGTSLPSGSRDLVDTWVANALAAEEQMKHAKTKATIGILSTLIAYVSLNSLVHSLRPSLFIWSVEDRELSRWLASPGQWIDKKVCRWVGICGITHFRRVRSTFGKRPKNGAQIPSGDDDNDWDWQNAWNEGKDRPEDWTDDERVLREIPQFVMEYAPIVHLFSGEQFWPCDIAEHLYHITPKLNYTPVQPRWQHPTLTDLDALNQWEHGRHVFLTSNDNVEERPEWLEGEKNIPALASGSGDGSQDETWTDWGSNIDNGDTWIDTGEDSTQDFGGTRPPLDPHAPLPVETWEGEDFIDGGLGEQDDVRFHDEARRRARGGVRKRTIGGRSEAPAVLVVVNKGHGIIDAFWFYFYSFNLGNTVLNVRFGNHVGDWEHSMVRFKHGKPKGVFFSEHSFGDAYHYDAVEKIGKRPVVYAARGSHANYATPGLQPYVLPWGILTDETDRGPLWDPALNVHSYTYDYIEDELRSSNFTPQAPVEWFYFTGHWGDKFYPLSDGRQYRFAGQYHYVNGPIGPRFKNLGRRKMCQGKVSDPCVIKKHLGDSIRIKRWRGPGISEQLSMEEQDRILGNGTHGA